MGSKVDTDGKILIVTSIFAHRGHHHRHPENSVAAVAGARALGADGVEVDVWLSTDNSLVVNHDRHLGGRDIARSARDDLREEPRVATLEEVLAVAGAMRVNVEIKATRSAAYNTRVARAVVERLDASPVSAQCLVSSFSLAVCDEVRRLSPTRPVGWLVTRPRSDDVLEQVRAHRLTSAHLPFTRVNEGVARRATALGIELHVWTPNLSRDLEGMLSRGVGALITDDVPLALSLRELYRRSVTG